MLDNVDNEIKKKLLNDKFISNNAEKVFENFLNIDFEKNKNDKVENLNDKKIVHKSFNIKKMIATAACITILLGGQIYASTQGYGNVFFLVKYLVTGQKTEVTGKENILSDRDITISYEPIQLTENIRIQVRNLQIKENKAKLFLGIEEKNSEENKEIVPLKYKVYNSKNVLICEKNSIRPKNSNAYTDELILHNFSEKDSSINLEVFKSNNEKLATIIIDLNTRELSVEGEEEALQKISEIELKEFLSYVVTFDSEIRAKNENDDKILFAKCMFNSRKSDNDNQLDEINKMIESLGYEKISDTYKGKRYKVVKSDDINIIKEIKESDISPATILNIDNISFSSGLYTVKFSYFDIEEEDTFDVDYSNVSPINAILYFKLNSDTNYSTFKVVRFEQDNEIKQNSINEEKEIKIKVENASDVSDASDVNDEDKNISEINNAENKSVESKTEDDKKNTEKQKTAILNEIKEDVYKEIREYINNNRKDITDKKRYVSTSIERNENGKRVERVAAEGINIFNVILDKIANNIEEIEKLSTYNLVSFENKNKQLNGSPKTIEIRYDDDHKDGTKTDMVVRWNINTPKNITFSWWLGNANENRKDSRANVLFTLDSSAEKIMMEIQKEFATNTEIRK